MLASRFGWIKNKFNRKLPLIGGGLLAAGGVAARLSIMSRRNRADRA